ncbi:MAG: type II secretion system inner membrane protein GspF [Candidatus Binatia bacterium]
MPVYTYKGLTPQGRTVTGILDADSPTSARVSLRRSGIFPTALDEEATRQTREATNTGTESPRLFERVPVQELALFTRQLATLIGAGLPLVECLETLGEQVERSALKRVLAHVRQQVREGSSLADALQAHPRVFSSIYVNMIRSGEASGALATVLSRLAEYAEGQARLLRTVQSALTYPLLMVIVASAILVFLLAYVVPQVLQIFRDTGQQLPLTTQALVLISSFLSDHWWELSALGVGSLFGFSRVLRTDKGRAWWDRQVLKLPWVGRLVQRLNVARVSRTLGTLLASGVPILTALDIVTQLVSNTRLRRALADARLSVQEGENLAAPLKRSGVFPGLFVQMVTVGERSGELESMLQRAAEAYDEEVATALSRLTSILEPLTILVMGGVVLFIVLAVLLPIFQLNQLVH